MRTRAEVQGLDRLDRQLLAIAEAAAAAAVAAASESLAQELERAWQAAGLTQPLARDGDARRRRIVARDPQSRAREFGTLDQPAAPWLAPVLPGARGPMRAAVLARVRDVVAAHAGKRN